MNTLQLHTFRFIDFDARTSSSRVPGQPALAGSPVQHSMLAGWKDTLRGRRCSHISTFGDGGCLSLRPRQALSHDEV
jgi:hypothetical protein